MNHWQLLMKKLLFEIEETTKSQTCTNQPRESVKDKIFMYLKVKKCSHALLCEPALMLDVIVSQLGEAAAPGVGRQASSDGPHSEVYVWE